MAAVVVPPRMADLSDVVGAEIDLTVISGRGLIPKDGGFGFGARTSDPYVVIAAVLPAARSGRGGHFEELEGSLWVWSATSRGRRYTVIKFICQ